MSSKQKIMIVDDEPRNQRIISETLEDLAEYQVCSSGEEALLKAEEFLPDIILLDIMMPGIDGYEVCKKIKANPKMNFTKVILVSGKAMIDEKIKGYEMGADDYITKPFVPEELLAKTKVFLKLTGIEKELSLVNQNLDKKVQERTQQLVDTEAKLIASAKMSALGEMAGGVAHEINTPLATIGLVAGQIQELVNEDPIDQQIISKSAQTISDTVGRIGTIITGLRTFSRDGSNDHFSHVPVKQIFENTLSLCREKLKQNQIELKEASISEELKVLARSVQISQVLLNMINNACDAIKPLKEKWIKLDAEKKDGMVLISITDSGNGIPAEVKSKMFQPFFTTKKIGQGTGLGLSISKGIIDAHKGSLTLDASCKHTRFVIELPEANEFEIPLKKAN